MSNEIKRFVLLGEAGAGKSTLINVLYNYFYGTTNLNEVFCENTQIKLAIPCKYWTDRVDKSFADQKLNERDINDMTISQTMTCRSYSFQNSTIHCEIIDTPGFNDTAGIEFDGRNLNCIEEELRSIEHLNGVIVVLNGSIDRVSVAFKNFLHLLRQVWANALFDTCIGILTNCDPSSVNLNPRLLYKELNINSHKTFHFQNNLFRWNRQKKPTKQLQEDFKEAVESVKMFLSVLQKSPRVPTDSFLVSPIKLGLIQNCIETSIQHLLDLVTAMANTQLAEVGISSSKLEMNRNTNRDLYHHINATIWEAMFMMQRKKPKDKKEAKSRNSSHVCDGQQVTSGDTTTQGCSFITEHPTHSTSAHLICTGKCHESDNLRRNEYESKVMYRPKQVTVGLVVPDGESLARYNFAEQAHNTLVSQKRRLNDERQELEVLIKSVFDTLIQQVHEIRKINKDYDLLEKNSAILQTFKRKTANFAGDFNFLKQYYSKTIEILSIK